MYAKGKHKNQGRFVQSALGKKTLTPTGPSAPSYLVNSISNREPIPAEENAMKTLKVISGPRYNPSVQLVQLNNVAPDNRLTPKLARRACQVAVGLGYGATVRDIEHGHGYAVYEHSSRKLGSEAG